MNEISEKVLHLGTLYLGPAAKTFLERQTKFHMKQLAFDDLKMEHLPELFKWIHISASLIIDDNAELLVRKLEAAFSVKRAT